MGKHIDLLGNTQKYNETLNCIHRYDDKQNILHTIDDSIKNLKSATDSLESFMSNYGRSSFETFKKVHVYSIHVIQKRLTLIQYSLKTPNTWKVIECSTAEIPLIYDARKKLIKILELFAFLYVSSLISSLCRACYLY